MVITARMCLARSGRNCTTKCGVRSRMHAGTAHLKVISGTVNLLTSECGRASLVAMMAGEDFIKTSTGKGRVERPLAVGVVMTRALRIAEENRHWPLASSPPGEFAQRNNRRMADADEGKKEKELGAIVVDSHLFVSGQAACWRMDIERQLGIPVTGRSSEE